MAAAQVNANQPVAVRVKRLPETPLANSDAKKNTLWRNTMNHNCNLDLDILECPICSEFFSSPVYQCLNGHPLCGACDAKVSRCPSCSLAIDYSRCLLVQKILESLQVRCPHAPLGCKQMLRYNTREEHIKNFCWYRPCPCPAPGCNHESSMQTLSQHLQEEHEVRSVSHTHDASSGCDQAEFEMTALMRASTLFVMLIDVNEEVSELLLHREVSETLREEIFFCHFFAKLLLEI